MRTYFYFFCVLIGCFGFFNENAWGSLEIPPIINGLDQKDSIDPLEQLQLIPLPEHPKLLIQDAKPSKKKKKSQGAQESTDLKKNIQSSIEIAAVVNNEIISTKDLFDRMQLITNGKAANLIKESPSEYKKLQGFILKELIDERLQVQIAKKSGLNVSEKEIEEALQTTEKQNNMPPGGLKLKLAQAGIPIDTLIEKFWAQIAWRNLILGTYQEVSRVSKMDIQDTLNKLSKKVSQYQLAEIVIYVDNAFEEEAAQGKVAEVMESLKQGTPFMLIAQQFSDAPSVTRGGDIGWIPEDQLDEKVVEILKQTSLNHSTPAIRTEDGYQILFLRDKIDFNQTAEVLTARQLDVKISEDILNDPHKLEIEKKRLNDLVVSIKNCQDFDQLVEQIEDATTSIYKNVRLEDLSSDLQLILSSLEINETSKGILNGDTMVFFMICYKGHLHPESMTKEQTLDQMVNQRLEAIAQQKLRDLRRVAAIDIRV